MPRVKKNILVCIQGHVNPLTMTQFLKTLPRFTKKVPGTARACACRRPGNPAIFTVWGLVTTVYK